MLHLETVSPPLLKIIKEVSSDDFFQHFRLVGGTALSLCLGHRKSVDADFFSNQSFEIGLAEKALLRVLPGYATIKIAPHGLSGFFEGVKIDLYTWHVPFLSPVEELEGIRMAALPDIAALKLDAIIERKEEKDFRDIHALLGVYPLSELLDFYRERIPHRDLRLVVDHLAAAPATNRQQSIELLRPLDYSVVSSAIIHAIQAHIASLKNQQLRKAEERLQNRLDQIQKRKKK